MADPKSRSAVERFINKTPPQHEPEVENESVREAYEGVRGREGIMLEVRLADGRCSGFSYAYLDRTDYVPGDTIRLRFPRGEIAITGRRLANLHRRLLRHRVEFVQEGTETEEGLKAEDAAHIDKITIDPEE